MRLTKKYLNLYIIVGIILLAIFSALIVPSSEFVEGTNQIVEVPKEISLKSIVESPIDSLVGNDNGDSIKLGNEGKQAGTISLVLLVLAIGSFVTICTKVGLFDSLIEAIVTSGFNIKQITVLLVTYFVISSTSYGLYESAICYIPILINLYKRYNISSLFATKVLLLSLSIGYIASPINPFATIVADTVANNTANLLLERSILLFVLYIALTIYLIWDLKKYNIEQLAIESNEGIEKLNYLNLLLFFIPYVYMTIGFIPNFMFTATMSSVTSSFVIVALLIGLINKFNIEKIIDYMLQGINEFMIIAISITLARTIYVIIYNAKVIDTIIYNIVSFLQPFNVYIIVFGVLVLFICLAFIIQSPSALAMITLPIIAPALNMIGIIPAVTVTIFLLAHGVSKMLSITSILVISSINSSNLSYIRYLNSIKYYVAFVFAITIGLTMFFI